jgi:hypothetical protein
MGVLNFITSQSNPPDFPSNAKVWLGTRHVNQIGGYTISLQGYKCHLELEIQDQNLEVLQLPPNQPAKELSDLLETQIWWV